MFADKNYQNTSVDDGDYLVQYGSEYMVQEFKKTWTNNTDNPSFMIKLRSTKPTSISPIYLQIYNINSATWETLDTENLQPADTDFMMSGRISTNVSNYYDSSLTVTFRVYQQII